MDTGVKDRKKWTPEEDALLMQAMKRFRYLQDVRWTEVAAIIPDRTPKACRKRWVNGLNGRLKKGSWSADEDERLRQGVAMLSSDWARIAEHVGQRSGDQCSKRWREVLDPAINKSAWTPEEDKLLTELYQMHGSAWQIISTSFNNRRALQCRNRCCKLLGLHGTPRFAATPSFDTESDNNGVSSGDLSKTATSAPVSPFRLAFSALPTPMTPFNQDDIWQGNIHLDISQNASTPQKNMEDRSTVGSVFNASPTTSDVPSPLYCGSICNPQDYTINAANWSLAPATNMSEQLTSATEDFKLNLTTLDNTSDLITQQLFASPGTMSSHEAISGPSTPSLSLPASRCNSGLPVSPAQAPYVPSCIPDTSSLSSYSLPPGHFTQSMNPCIQDVAGESIGSMLFPMNDNFSFSVGMPKDGQLQPPVPATQDTLQWMAGLA